MHKPESVLENETQNIFWDFELQTDHLISTTRPSDSEQKKKKKKENQPKSGLCHKEW